MSVERIVALTRTYSVINPAATQRQIQALTAQLLTMTTSKAGPTAKAQLPKRARSHEPQVPFPGRLAGVKMGSGCLPTPTFPWDLVSPHMSLAPGL
jgi:hypothetical protein